MKPYYEHSGITIFHGDVVECDSWMPTNAPAVTELESAEKMSHSLSVGQSPDSSKAPNTSQSALNGEKTITHGRAMQSLLNRDDQGPSESIPSSEAASSAEPSERSATTSTATRRTMIQVTSPLFAGNATCSQTEDSKNLSNSPSVSSRELLLPAGIKTYYNHNGIVIIHGDCREILPGLRADAVVTDPPYGLGIAGNPVRQKYAVSDWDNEPADALLIDWCRVAAPYQIIWGGNYFGLPAQQCFLVWDKIQPENFSLAMCEQAWTNLRGPAKMFRKSVLSYMKEHPTEKPVELLEWCINRLPEGCETILDPFMGSGTTLVAAKNLGRKAIGIEICEEYCEIAARRLSQEVFDFGTAL